MSDRKTQVQRNVERVKSLQRIHPGQIRMVSSEAALDGVDTQAMMNATQREFDNADQSFGTHVESEVSSGRQVVVLPMGVSQVMVFAGHGLLGNAHASGGASSVSESDDSASGCFVLTGVCLGILVLIAYVVTNCG